MPERLLQTSLEQVLGQIPPATNLAVALSGGPDSSALAICADQWARSHGRSLWLFHVHHGLHAQADDWAARVQRLAQLVDRPLMIEQVSVDLSSGLGLEGAARLARYAALQTMAAAQGVQGILLAHHQQDQAETVLMRLLRGAGVTGLAAMAPVSRRDNLYWVRPWLDVARQALLDDLAVFTERTGWLPVDDPSNDNSDLARGLLRSRLVPAIESHWPAWQQTLARHAQQAAQAQRLLSRYGEQLLGTLVVQEPSGSPMAPSPNQAVNVPPVLSLARWRGLNPDEQVLSLRTWLSQARAQMPTDRRLNELLRQLRQLHALGHDRDLRWGQRDCTISCIRGHLHLHVKIEGFNGEGAARVGH